MAPHPSICQTLRMMVVPMVSRRFQLHPAEALAGHIDPETPVVPSQSLRSPLSVEATQVSSAAKDTKQKDKKTQGGGDAEREGRRRVSFRNAQEHLDSM